MGFVAVKVLRGITYIFLGNHTWRKEDSFMMISGLEVDIFL